MISESAMSSLARIYKCKVIIEIKIEKIKSKKMGCTN